MIDELRARFPGLADGWVRFDGPAGTLPVDRSIEAMHRYYSGVSVANTGGFFDAAETTEAMAEAVRGLVGQLVGADAQQVIFGQSATALVFAYTRALAQHWTTGTRVLCTQLDHDSNVTPWVLAARDAGATVTMLPVNPADGSFDLAHLAAELAHGQVAWVALSGASNLTGFAPDLRTAVSMVHAAGAKLHVDAVARVPHLPVDVNGLGIDSLVTSPYKWYGPHAGVLVLQPELLHGVEPYRVRPADYVGPSRWETGTGAYEVIAGIGGAAQFMLEDPMDAIVTAEGLLLARLESGLRSLVGVTVHSPLAAEGRAPTTIFNIDGISPESIARSLATKRVAVWSGDNYACELVDALGLRANGGAVRAGIARYTSEADVDALLDAVSALRP